MELSKKLKTFFQFFIPFPTLTSNFEHFEGKDKSQSLSISEIMESQKRVYLIIQKVLFYKGFRQ